MIETSYSAPCGKLEIVVHKAVCRGVNLNIDTKIKSEKKLIAWNSFLEKTVMSFYSFWSRRVGSLLAN